MNKPDFVAIAREIGPAFAERAAAHDAADSFVDENYAELKVRGFLSAAVPSELGGGGATHAELCAMLRELAHYCPSTALALSMHTHQVAIPAWRWRNENGIGEPLLRRVAAEDLVLVSSGASDWLDSSGTLAKKDGGYALSGRKVFASGSPGGDLLMTSGVLADPESGEVVLHFPLPLRGDGVSILDNWRTLGMRGTGSNDVTIDEAFIPEAAVGLRRPKGKWHFIYHLTVMIAMPLIMSVYVGVAEAARELALERARRKPDALDVQLNVGEMENELRNAQIAVDSAVAYAATAKPGPETTNEELIRRTIAGRSAMRTVDRALDVAGGAGFFRTAGLERLFRDVQGARYHPMQEKRQLEYTGRLTLGLPLD